MKTKISRIGKKSLSVIIALMMIVSTMLVGMVSVSATITGYSAIYFTPGSNWRQGDAIFKLEVDSNKIDFVCVDETNYIYKATLDSNTTYNNLKFLRINPADTTVTWDYSKTFSWISYDKSLNYYKMKDDLWKDWDVNLTNGTWFAYSGGSGDTETKYYYSYYDGSNQYKEMKNNNGVYTYSPTTSQLGNTEGVAKFKITTSDDTTKDPANNNTLCVNKNSPTVTRSTAMETAGITAQLNNDEFNDVQISDKTKEYVITFTPSSSNALTGTINVDLKSSTPTPTTKYYLGGRITEDSNDTWIQKDNTTYPFVATETLGLYKYVSRQTPAVWSETRNNLKQYFYVHTGKDNYWYGTSGTTAELSSSGQSVNLTSKTYGTDTEEKYLTYINSTDTTGNVIFYLDTNNGMKLWYTTEGSTPAGKYNLADKSGNYGKVVFTVNGNTVTRANEGDEVTATVTPNTGFDFVADSFSVTNDTSKEAVGTPTGTTLKFTMPASNVTATAKFALNKAEYVKTLEDGLYVDVAPDKNDTTATFVMWNNYTGVGQDAPSSGYAAYITKDYRTLYIPANVDLSSVTLYNAYSSDVKINGQTIPADGTATVSLTETTYSADSNNTYKVQVLKGSTSSMFLYTNDGNGNDYDLPTSKKNYTGLMDKETVKASGGLCTTIKGSKVSDALDLSQVKGRGNSSWEASALLFGKYAFNMKLSSATSLFDLPKSKSFCLLANNMDDAMMRNAYIYQLAKDIGLYDSPEFEFVDIYDNGEYMGAYLVTEKVDVGDKNKLIKGNSIDDLNEDAGAIFDEDHPARNADKTLGYANITNGVDLDNNTEFKNKYQTTGTYLLEFEIPDRVNNEPSYFKSSKGQHVVLKNPEFATEGEVKFIRDKFNEMEALVYADTIDLEKLSKVMDLDSFARMYLIQEFTSNLDSAATSYYITYDCSKGLFVASPVWDYDMALGQNQGSKYDKNGNNLWANNAEAWFAKYKAMGDGKQSGSYSLQSKLATDSNFQTVIKKVWFGKNNDGFYNKVQAYYQDGGYLDTWKTQISKSISMNEERWGFIANNPARSSWGSPNTTGGNGFTGAVDFLKTSWSSKRGTWLNNEFDKYSNYTQIATPTLTAYAADGTTPLVGEVTAGDTYVLKADTSEIYVDYVLYDGSTKVDENSNGVFKIINATAGIHNYTVKTVYNSTDIKTSEETIVTVSSSPALEGVTLTANPTEVTVGYSITLTATVTPSTATGVTYTFYQSTDNSETTPDDDVKIETVTNNVATVTASETTGNYYYYVVATHTTGEIKSTPVSVKVTNEGTVIENVKIRFKGTTLSSLIPYMSVDGGAAEVMTRSTPAPIGTHLSGAYRFVWFEATIDTVTVGQSKTLTFTTEKSKESTMNASITLDFTTLDDNVIYLAVDNLMSGTTAVDITDNETAKNSFGSAMNMIKQSSAVDPVATTLLSTMLKITSASGKVTTKRYYLGDLDSDNTIGIKDATEIQKSIAGTSELDAEYQSLGDFNADGVVDIKDATAIQKYIAGF